MRPSICRLFPLTILIGVLVSTTAAATPTFSRDGAAPTVRAVAVHGNEIVVTVSNVAPQTARQPCSSGDHHRRGNGHGDPSHRLRWRDGPGHGGGLRSRPLRVPLGVVLDDGVPF